MERPIFKPVGTPVAELDTPALVVDLTRLEHNLRTFHAFFRDTAAKLRPHVTVHRCPALAHKQLAAGHTVGGISVSTLGEAEVFADQGFSDIFVRNEIVTAPKIRRLCALARRARLTVAVDQAQNVRDLSDAAGVHGVTLHVVVEVQTSPQRCGVEPGQAAVALAHTVQTAPHLAFAGLMTREGSSMLEDQEARLTETRRATQQLLDTRTMVERAGLAVQIVSAGNTATAMAVGSMSGVTEIPAGVYALLDAHHAPCCPQLTPAARVLTTVTSRPEPETAITDAGQKAVSLDLGLPIAAELPQATVTSLSAEHCRIQLADAARHEVKLGAKLWLTPRDLGTCANLYDYLHAVREGQLEAVWRVAARGQYR
ncbi:MAG: alanine racemase [Candidatus Tectimicrobiota bacterium]